MIQIINWNCLFFNFNFYIKNLAYFGPIVRIRFSFFVVRVYVLGSFGLIFQYYFLRVRFLKNHRSYFTALLSFGKFGIMKILSSFGILINFINYFELINLVKINYFNFRSFVFRRGERLFFLLFVFYFFFFFMFIFLFFLFFFFVFFLFFLNYYFFF